MPPFFCLPTLSLFFLFQGWFAPPPFLCVWTGRVLKEDQNAPLFFEAAWVDRGRNLQCPTMAKLAKLLHAMPPMLYAALPSEYSVLEVYEVNFLFCLGIAEKNRQIGGLTLYLKKLGFQVAR